MTLVTITEAAALCGHRSRGQLYRLKADGRLQGYIRQGGRAGSDLLETDPPGLPPLAAHVLSVTRLQINNASRPEPGPPSDPLEEEIGRLRRQVAHLAKELQRSAELEERWESQYQELWTFAVEHFTMELMDRLGDCEGFPMEKIGDAMVTAREVLVPRVRALEGLQLEALGRREARERDQRHGATWWLRAELL